MKPAAEREVTVLDLRPHGYDADVYTLEAKKVRLRHKKYPGSDLATLYNQLIPEYEIVELPRESAAEAYGKMGMLLLLPALFGYYALEVGWGLFVIAGLCALPAGFMLRARLKPLRRRMNFRTPPNVRGLSIGYYADEETKVVAFGEELKRHLQAPAATRIAGPEPKVAGQPEHQAAARSWSAPVQLEVRKRRGMPARFVLEEVELVVSPEAEGEKEQRIPYWKVSTEYLRNPDPGRQVGRALLWMLLWLPLALAFGWGALVGVRVLWIPAALAAMGVGSLIHGLFRERSSQYLFFEEIDGEVAVRIPFDQAEEPRVLEFVAQLEDRLQEFSSRRREENRQVEEDGEED